MDLTQYKFAKSHEWIKIEGDTAIIGISKYAIEELGDIVFLEYVADEDEEIKKGDVFGNIESHKAAEELYSPISGKVIESNKQIEESPENLKEDAYENGWMIKIKYEDKSEINDLMTEADYQDYVQSL